MTTVNYSTQGRVKKSSPCPICGYTWWCVVSDCGNFVRCMRSDTPVGDWDFNKATQDGGWQFIRHNFKGDYQYTPPSPAPKTAPRPFDGQQAELNHRVYFSLLANLGISTTHKNQLTDPHGQRRLKMAEIQALGVKSWRYGDSSRVMADLLTEFSKADLLKVPGFYLDGNSLKLAAAEGLLIPIFQNGQIAALRIRPDKISGHNKYLWVSSANRGGPSPASIAALYSPLSGDCIPGKVGITEGEFKAFITAQRLGYPVISVPGIGVWKNNNTLGLAAEVAGKAGEVVIFYDNELNNNTIIQRNALAETLILSGHKVSIASWSGPKGIDDLLLAKGEFTTARYCPDMEGLKVDTVVNEPELSGLHLSGKKASLIKSPKGTRKTKELSKVIATVKRFREKVSSDSDKKVIAIGHRVSLTQAAAAQHDLGFYQDYAWSNSELNEQQDLAITVDSLHKLNTEGLKVGLLVIDECEQVLQHMCGATIKDHRQPTQATLEYLIKVADKILFLDADLSPISYNFLARIIGPENIEVIVNTALPRPKTYKMYDKEVNLQAEVLAQLGAGKKVFIATNSKDKSEFLAQWLKEQYLDLSGWLINSDTIASLDQHERIETINQSIQAYDYVIATPSLGTGISIEVEHFDSVFLFAEGGVNTHTDLLQQVARVRVSKSNTVHCYITRKNPAKPATKDEIKLNCRENLEQTLLSIKIDNFTGERRIAEDEADYLELYSEVQAARRTSMANLRENFLKAAGREGHTIEFFEDDFQDKKEAVFNNLAETINRHEDEITRAQATIETNQGKKKAEKTARKEARATKKQAKEAKKEARAQARKDYTTLKSAITEVREGFKQAKRAVKEARATGMIEAEQIDDIKYDKLRAKQKNSKALTPDERFQLEKKSFTNFYGAELLNEENINLDDKGRLRSRIKAYNAYTHPDYALELDTKEVEQYQRGYISQTELHHWQLKNNLRFELIELTRPCRDKFTAQALIDCGFIAQVKARKAEIERVLDVKVKSDFEQKPLGLLGNLYRSLGLKVDVRRVRTAQGLGYVGTLNEKHNQQIIELAGAARSVELAREKAKVEFNLKV